MKQSRIALAVVIVIIIIIAGFFAGTHMSSSNTSISSSTSSVASSQTPTTLTIDDAAWPIQDFAAFGSSMGLWNWPMWTMYTVYQPLVTVNETAEWNQGVVQLLPSLATNWTASSSGTVYTFTLRQDVKYSNGDPFNAYQAWLAFYTNYYILGSLWMDSMSIYNYTAVQFGPATISVLTQSGLINPSPEALAIMSNTTWPIYVTGPYTLAFHITIPYPYLPALFVGWPMPDMQWVLENGGLGTPSAPNAYLDLHAAPGTGPYIVTSITEKSSASFTQNPNYWGRNLTAAQIAANPLMDPGHVQNVVIYYKPDDLARYTDLTTGTAQISAIQGQNWPAVEANPD